MSNYTHNHSKICSHHLIKENSTLLSKRSNTRTKSSISTLDISVKIPTIPNFSELDSLYQQFLNVKTERKKSQRRSSEIINKANYSEKEQQVTRRVMQKIKNDMINRKRSQLICRDSKERQELINAQRELNLKKQKEKNAKLKSSIDYISKTWKDQVRVKHETISNKSRLVKYRNASCKNRIKMNEYELNKEKCMKIKKGRAISVEKREQNQKIKLQLKEKEIIDKIKKEKEKKEEYEKLIKTFKNKGDEIISRMENLNKKSN